MRSVMDPQTPQVKEELTERILPELPKYHDLT
jgi:hypothetical protein